MKILELFCGTNSVSNVFKENGHQVFTVDFDKQFNPDLCINIVDLLIGDIHFMPDIIWASPPCQCFSVASISTHWKGGTRAYIPKTNECINALKLLDKTIVIISVVKPKFWFIENPRGVMRKVIENVFKRYSIKDYVRHTVTYCQYGDNRMKPTDIWTNNKNWIPKKVCSNGDDCHISAPRGSKTGTQGLNNARDRAVIPKELCQEIYEACIS